MKVPAFADIGKQTRDILIGTSKSGFYQYDNKFKITAKASDGVSLQLLTVKKGEKIVNDIKSTLNKDPYSLEIIANQTGNVGVTASVSDLFTPGLKLTGKANLPKSTPPKVTIGYVNPHVNVSTGIQLEAGPQVEGSILAGYKNFLIGGDCYYSTAKGQLAKWALGVGYQQHEYEFGLLWLDKGETVKGMLSHKLSRTTEIGAEISKNVTKQNEGSVNLGLSKILENGALVKAKAESSGLVSVLWEQKLDSMMKVTISGQSDVCNFEKGAKMGIAFDMNS